MARLKRPDKIYKTESIGVRCTEEQRNLIETKALLYCEGVLSEYILHAALNYEVRTEDLEDDNPKNKKA